MESVANEPATPDDRATAVRRVLRNPFVWAFLAGAITLPLIRPLLRHEPPPPPVLGQLPPFTLTAADGRPFGNEDLAGKVWVADFIFTRCGSICPLLSRSMASLQKRYSDWDVDGVRLVSITVDPDYDTPERLSAYGETYGRDPERWTMLTGSLEDVRKLVVGGFRLAMGSREEAGADVVDVAHSGRLVLVDGKGRIRGYYDSDAEGLDEVFHRSIHVLREARRQAGG